MLASYSRTLATVLKMCRPLFELAYSLNIRQTLTNVSSQTKFKESVNEDCLISLVHTWTSLIRFPIRLGKYKIIRGSINNGK